MQRIEVQSSLLKAIGYDAASQTLMIEFKPKKEGEAGKVYRYANVSPETYKKFTEAKSLGSHFLKEIKPAHACTRIEEKPNAETETENKKDSGQARKPFNTATEDEKLPF